MQHHDDAFATMLLMSQINPSREELVLPLNTAEWHQLQDLVAHSEIGSMGELLRTDMSRLMFSLGYTEEQAYRLCVLLGRTLPLSISMEQCTLKGIEHLTYNERNYPAKLREVLGDKAPPMLYIAGRPEIFRQNAIAILGALPPKVDAELRVRQLTEQAIQAGYVIVTDGQNGLGRIALDEAMKRNGRAILVLAGAMSETLLQPNIAEWLAARRITLISQFHPDSLYTPSHAQVRNKCIYALSQAAFVFACDEDKGSSWTGAVEALRAKWCRFIYAWDSDLYGGNRALIQRGATPMPELDVVPFSQLAENWINAQAEQTCLFDWDAPEIRH